MDVSDAIELISLGSVAITAMTLVELSLEITITQWRAVVVLGPHPDGLTVSEIAERLPAALSPTSRLVSRLRRRGLVETAKDPSDRRTTRVRLSPAGAELREMVFSRRRKHFARLSDQLGPLDDADAAFLARLANAYGRFA